MTDSSTVKTPTPNKVVNPFTEFGTDPNLEKNGVDIVIRGMTFTCARAGGSNAAYTRFMQKKMDPYKFELAMGQSPIDEEDALKIQIEAYAETVLKGWKGVGGPDGKALPFTKENVVMLFTRLPDLFKMLQRQVTNHNIYLAKAEEVLAGN